MVPFVVVYVKCLIYPNIVVNLTKQVNKIYIKLKCMPNVTSRNTSLEGSPTHP